MNITISIIIATYNRPELILETLESISNQTFKDYECIIVDDCLENNKTEFVIKSFSKHDSRFNYYRRNTRFRKGLPGCRNCGIELSKGDFILFFDDDDIMHPQNLELSLCAIKNSEKSFCRFQRDVFFGQFSKTIKKQKPGNLIDITRNDFYNILTNKLPFNSCQILWKKQCFENYRFNEQLMYAEEWECYLKIILAGFEGVNIENTLMYARKHSKSNTGEYFDGSSTRLDSHAEAIESLLRFMRNTDSLSFRVKKYLFNEYLRLKGHLIFVKLLSTIVGPLESRFWQTYARLIPFRMKLYQMRKSFKTTS
ncbi:glycosyltransferase family 2 protein [Flavobacteriaceae bacterium]|nr:glycosyltransferase family 2 protein [Flavobacteriaceae bacterium]